MSTPLIRTVRPSDEHAFLAAPRDIGIAEVIRWHWRLIVFVAFAGSLATFLSLRAIEPLYSAGTTVMIDPREEMPVVSSDHGTFLPPSEAAVRTNEIALIRSREAADAVARQLKLDDDPEFNPLLRKPTNLHLAREYIKNWFANWLARVGLPILSPAAPAPLTSLQAHERVVDNLLARLGTKSPEASRVIEIIFTSPNPLRAVEVASAVADHYLRDKHEEDLKQSAEARESLVAEIASVNQSIANGEHQIEVTRVARGLPSDTDVSELNEQLRQLAGQLSTAQAEKAALEAKLAILREAKASPEVLQSLDMVQISPAGQRLQMAMADAVVLLNSRSVMYGATHPKVLEARAAIDALRGQMMGEIDKLSSSLTTSISIANQKAISLRTLTNSAKELLTNALDAQSQIRLLGRQVEASKALLTQLVSRLNNLDAQTNVVRPGVRIISAATIPYAPTFPPTRTMMALAPIASGALGLLIAMWIARRDSSIRSTVQLRQLTSAQVLGAVPAVRRLDRLRSNPVTQIVNRRTSVFAENLRAVWLQIDRARGDRPRTLLVTSSLPHEGKSSFATSLARLLAAGGRSVVIIDADLRSPSVHHEYGLSESPGLAELVSGTCDLAEALQIDSSGANVITAGRPVVSPADVLQSPAVPKILEMLRARFDTVIIDAPPVLAVADAGILAEHADLTALVVRWGATKTVDLEAALQRLQDFNAHVGIILTMVDGRRYAQYADGNLFLRPVRS